MNNLMTKKRMAKEFIHMVYKYEQEQKRIYNECDIKVKEMEELISDLQSQTISYQNQIAFLNHKIKNLEKLEREEYSRKL